MQLVGQLVKQLGLSWKDCWFKSRLSTGLLSIKEKNNNFIALLVPHEKCSTPLLCVQW